MITHTVPVCYLQLVSVMCPSMLTSCCSSFFCSTELHSSSLRNSSPRFGNRKLSSWWLFETRRFHIYCPATSPATAPKTNISWTGRLCLSDSNRPFLSHSHRQHECLCSLHAAEVADAPPCAVRNVPSGWSRVYCQTSLICSNIIWLLTFK